MGLEPILRPWKGLVLPLHHTRLCDPLWSVESRSGGIRTHDLLNPNEARYQASLRSEHFENNITNFRSCLATIFTNNSSMLPYGNENMYPLCGLTEPRTQNASFYRIINHCLTYHVRWDFLWHESSLESDLVLILLYTILTQEYTNVRRLLRR